MIRPSGDDLTDAEIDALEEAEQENAPDPTCLNGCCPPHCLHDDGTETMVCCCGFCGYSEAP